MGLRRSFKPTNLVANGDFSEGTTGWSGSNGNSISTENNVLANTGAGTYANPYAISTNMQAIVNNKYYSRAIMRTVNGEFLLIRLALMIPDFTLITSKSSPSLNTWYRLSGVSTATSTGTFRVYLGSVFSKADLSLNAIMEAKEVMTINLTEVFGVGDEPDQAWCDLNIPNWFDRTLSGGSFGGIGGFK